MPLNNRTFTGIENLKYFAALNHLSRELSKKRVDEIIETLLNKRKVAPSYKFYLELDGCTLEDWIRNPSSTQDHFKSVLDDGGAELVSGAYTQPW